MKKGPAIIIAIGIALLAFLYFSPVIPPAETNTVEAKETEQSEYNPDEQVDKALEELRSGATPPMEAILKIRKVAEDYPDNIKANYTLGLLSMQTAQYDKAISRFQTVIKNEPEDLEAHRFLAQALLNTGDTVAALDTYNKALSLADETAKSEIEQEIKNLSTN